MIVIRMFILYLLMICLMPDSFASQRRSSQRTLKRKILRTMWVIGSVLSKSTHASMALPNTSVTTTASNHSNPILNCSEQLLPGHYSLRYVQSRFMPSFSDDEGAMLGSFEELDSSEYAQGYWSDVKGCSYSTGDYVPGDSGSEFDVDVAEDGTVTSMVSSDQTAEIKPSGFKKSLIMVANSDRDVTWAMEESARMYLSQSYGSLNFTYDYLRVDGEMSCSLGVLCNSFKEKASYQVSLSDYNSYTIVMSDNSCPYGGVAFVRGNCQALQPYSDNKLAALKMHEDGHNLGGGHANKDGAEYKDYNDALGASYRTRTGFNAPHRIQFGWLDSRQISTLVKGGHVLWNLDDVESNRDKTLVLSSGDYTVSFRAVDDDNYFSKEVDGDIIEIHYHAGGARSTNLIKELEQGHDFILNNKTRITFHNIQGKTAFIEVSRGSQVDSHTITVPRLLAVAVFLTSSLLYGKN